MLWGCKLKLLVVVTPKRIEKLYWLTCTGFKVRDCSDCPFAANCKVEAGGQAWSTCFYTSEEYAAFQWVTCFGAEVCLLRAGSNQHFTSHC